MNVLITGGAGYVGSHCVKAMLNAGHDVVVFDNLQNGHRKAVDDRASFIHADLSNESLLTDLLINSRVDAVIHFAASMEVGESVKNPLKYYANNVANSCTLLRAMSKGRVRRLVFSSTAAVYGIPESCPIVEDMPRRPINPYGRTKLAVEWAIGDCASACGLGACALRYFNASGASLDGTIGEDHDPETHLIPIVLQVAQGKRDHVSVFGSDYPTEDGTCVRDYVHVEDLAAAHLLALESIRPGRLDAFNVGTGHGTSVLQIIEAARTVTGQAIPAIEAERREGDPPWLYANSDRLQRELGWRPLVTDLDDIVRSAWNWHRANPAGYQSADVIANLP